MALKKDIEDAISNLDGLIDGKDDDPGQILNDAKQCLVEASKQLQDGEKGRKLIKIVQDFVNKHAITCEETLYQCDGPQEDALDFIGKLCDVVGYFEYPDE